MVAPATPRIDYVPEPNFARAFLFRAADALAAGNVTTAGVFLREAIRRQCFAECQWFDCLPEGASERMPPIVLLKALHQAGRCGTNGDWFEVIGEMISLSNAAAHCKRISAKLLRTSIEMFHGVIDQTPCGEPANIAGLPTSSPSWESGEYSIDDDERRTAGDWWKPEGWNPGGAK